MIQLNLTEHEARKLLINQPDVPGLREAYEEAKRHNFPALQEVKFFLSDTNACGVVRSDEIAGAMNKYARPHRADCKALTTPSDLTCMTAAIFQRQRNPGLVNYIAKLRDKGIKVFYDLDDDLFNVPPEFAHVHHVYSEESTKEAIRSIMKACTAVTVASKYLAEEVKRQVGGEVPVVYIPNAIDLGTWYPMAPTVDDPVIIGWMASGTHTYDCQLMDKVMPSIVEEIGYNRVLVEVVGNVSDKELTKWGIQFRRVPWTKYHDLPSVMSRWSLGIAPVQDNPFNNSKSFIKVLQYWGLEKPVVASDTPVYDEVVKNGENGFLASTPEEWIEALVMLVKDVDFRQRLGHNGHNKVADEYDLKDRVWDWVRLAAEL